ncbi:MAG: hypothetical protein KBT29_09570 [Prevotellaceae bacterium]|nr:hypothetical protein [Candidatus Minthosoma caballi]
MKKLFYFVAILATTVLGMSSCLDDVNADATVNYIGVCDSINYSDPANKEYDTCIVAALADMGYTMTMFSESAKSNTSNSDIAVLTCHEQAGHTWEAKTKKLKVADIADNVYKKYSTKLTAKDIHCGADLNLKTLYLNTSVISGLSGQKIWTFRDTIY